ncbi:MAG: tetratricopeptide repeat protein, partial [Gemmatimonadetes bacterium]|nr:tetratricopeptide repeat protein [Gemmatimonadota bacterium]
QLGAFKEEHPDAEDLDALSAALASRLLGQGKRDEAMAVLSGIEGPGAALERAFLLLEGGTVTDAIAALQASLPDLEPSHATEILELTLALSELTAPGAALAARAAIASHRGNPEHAVTLVRDGLDGLPAPDRPAILALGARVADRVGLTEDATALWRRIVTEHPDAREYPEAALRFARALAAEPGGRDEAVRILEALIVARPDSPVVPGARRELRRIQTGNPGPGGGGS